MKLLLWFSFTSNLQTSGGWTVLQNGKRYGKVILYLKANNKHLQQMSWTVLGQRHVTDVLKS